MDCLRRNLRALRRLCWMPPPDQEHLQETFLYIYLSCFAFSFLNYMIFGTGGTFFGMGSIGLLYSGFVYYADRIMKLAWALWLHFGVLLVLSGFVFRDGIVVFGDTLIYAGLFIILVIWIAPCFGYRILNRRRPDHNGHAIVYQFDLEPV